jgi:hypothetical protein
MKIDMHLINNKNYFDQHTPVKEQNFQTMLKAEQEMENNSQSPSTTIYDNYLPPTSPYLAFNHETSSYQLQKNQHVDTWYLSGLKQYCDDQLLSNPGGDHYYLKEKKVVDNPTNQQNFYSRIGKDLSDALDNIKNFYKDLLWGANMVYRDQNNQIQEAATRGLLGSMIDFFKDIGSAFSLGVWRPEGETNPQGAVERLNFSFSKLKEALIGDLFNGVGGSFNHIAEDLVLAGWNLIEVIPDATIGNFEDGQKLTTTIFDNGQVVIDYLTDIMPTGEAWLRVHTFNVKELELPILCNLKMPEYFNGDERWQYIRNTPFRKAIETIGSLLADIITLKLTGRFTSYSAKTNSNLGSSINFVENDINDRQR